MQIDASSGHLNGPIPASVCSLEFASNEKVDSDGQALKQAGPMVSTDRGTTKDDNDEHSPKTEF
jgi:hypothetical protein